MKFSTASDRPTIGITMGDAAGIGPEIVVKSLADIGLRSICRPVVIGDAACLHRTAAYLGLSTFETGEVEILDLANLPPDFEIGADHAVTGKASAENIEAAISLWKDKRIDAVCTAPISKKAINLGGYDFPGHTEFLASLTGTTEFAMSFFAGELRVVLLSTHHSLRAAIELVKKEAIVDLIRFTDRELVRLLNRPVTIAVAGLNPHASEGGKFGSEEHEEIIPAVNECKSIGINASGPYSPDTIFLRGHKGDFDAVIALYHDQATIAVKSLSFGSGVNVTLGLPLKRTSVDHGTAYDIAGRGIADASSMLAAIRLAAELAREERSARAARREH
ncbi:MAG TPA: 4-hydroxythreonine-4-phosphate dehydrogenase PdxA [Pyrinomonadaceae bacterium]|nr:4-hydroxythreonine-4-phosphate dehydrogenase PdxA [Pyrinomonadaceae bacterium]